MFSVIFKIRTEKAAAVPGWRVGSILGRTSRLRNTDPARLIDQDEAWPNRKPNDAEPRHGGQSLNNQRSFVPVFLTNDLKPFYNTGESLSRNGEVSVPNLSGLTRLLLVACPPILLLLFAGGCQRDVASTQTTREDQVAVALHRHWEDVEKTPYDVCVPIPLESVRVLSGTMFSFQQDEFHPRQTCRLWGLAEPSSASERESGREFLRKWFKALASCAITASVKRNDQTIAWLEGRTGSGIYCPNTEIVVAGRARVEYADVSALRFTVLTKEHGRIYVDWKAQLKAALQKHADGIPPFVPFPWPSLVYAGKANFCSFSL